MTFSVEEKLDLANILIDENSEIIAEYLSELRRTGLCDGAWLETRLTAESLKGSVILVYGMQLTRFGWIIHNQALFTARENVRPDTKETIYRFRLALSNTREAMINKLIENSVELFELRDD